MNRLERWKVCLLLWHLLIVVAYFRLRITGNLTPYWMGSLLAFSLPTVQFTWSLTVALMVGPDRRRRKRYWSVLLMSFIPLEFVYVVCMLANIFLGVEVAALCLIVLLAALVVETMAGIFCGNEMRVRLRRK